MQVPMLNNQLSPPERYPFPEVIDNTMRSEFVSCPLKFYYSFIRKLGSPYPSIDLIAGGAFAKGLETTRKLFYSEDSEFRGKLAPALERGMLDAIAEYGDIEVPEHKMQKAPERVVTALGAYFDRYPPSADYIQPMYSGGRPMVEFSFSVPLPISHPITGNPIIYAGRFDMVGLYNGQVVGVDEKTTSQLGASWVNQWNLRSQFTGYCWALKQYDMPVVGVVVRGVSFLKQTKSNPIGHDFAESIQMRAQWQIDQWYEQLLKDVERMKAAYTSGWFDQNLADACSAYGGCGFQKLCTSAEPENWIEGNYAPREWNPLKKVPAEQPKQEAGGQVVLDADLMAKFEGVG